MKHSIDVSCLSQHLGFSHRTVRMSADLYSDCIDMSPVISDEWEIHELDRLEMLLESAAQSLSSYPSGTRSACFTHHRLPPDGDINQPLAIPVEAAVVEPRGADPYLLLALRGEATIAFAA